MLPPWRSALLLLRPAPPGSSYRRWLPSCPFGPAALPPAGGLPPALSARSLFPAAPQIRSPPSVSAWSPSSAGFPGARAFRPPGKGSAFCRPLRGPVRRACGPPAGRPALPAPFTNFCPYYIPYFRVLQSVLGGSTAPVGPISPGRLLRGAGPHGRPPLGSPRADPPFYCGQPSAAAGRPASSTASTSRIPSSGDCPFCSFTVR